MAPWPQCTDSHWPLLWCQNTPWCQNASCLESGPRDGHQPVPSPVSQGRCMPGVSSGATLNFNHCARGSAKALAGLGAGDVGAVTLCHQSASTASFIMEPPINKS